MRRRIPRIVFLSLLSMMAVAAVAIAAVYLRLAGGPIGVDFLKSEIEARINQNLSGMAISLDGVIIEREAVSGIPHLRLSGLTLRDDRGNLIARAPRAAIGIDEAALMRAAVVPRSLELIGPRIFITRTLAGNVQLGFGTSDTATPAPAANPPLYNGPGPVAAGKSDQPASDPGQGSEVSGDSLVNILSGGGDAGSTSIGSIERIKVSSASIRLYDEANNAVWQAPMAELTFNRKPGGFVVVTDAAIANARGGGSWRTELSATYTRASHGFSISARINDLVPADISNHVYALSQLAQVKVPLSGQADMEVSETGVISKASAELTAAAGKVGLPNFIADTIVVDEGSLRADYDPATGGLAITDSTLLVGSSRAELTGKLTPVRQGDGRLMALDIDLKAHNVAIDAQGTNKTPVSVDHIDFSGRAAIDAQRLDINDLVVMSGSSGVRIRGAITGGAESAGILLSGRIRDVSAGLLKRLWPPVVAPKTRKWIGDNISEGRIADGGFQVNLPADAMARAQKELTLPPGSVDMMLNLAGVTTGYFKSLPPLRGADGTAVLKDNDFTLSVAAADIPLPSGKSVHMTGGQMISKDILAVETPTTITVNAAAAIPAVLDYLSLPDLNLAGKTGFDAGKLTGNAKVQVVVKLPLMADIPENRVEISARAQLNDAALKGVLPKIDITGGQFDVVYGKGALAAAGPAKINGVDAKLTWRREAGNRQSAVLETTLGADDRAKIGADLDSFLTGPVAVKATIDDLSDPEGTIAIEADLSKASMHLDAVNWAREATPKTKASFVYHGKGDNGRRIEGLTISGPGLSIKGDAWLAASGNLKEAKFSEVHISDENRFALDLKNDDNGTSLAISGDSFDARPLISAMFKTSPGGGGAAAASGTMAVSANLDRVYAHRGEIVTGLSGNVTTRGGKVQAAELSGNFLSGQPVAMRLTPAGGGRDLQVLGRDGGAALRAANLYSKIAGGQIEFHAVLANDANSSVRSGQLVLRNFEVRNEAAFTQLDTKGTPKKNGPRREGLAFYKLSLPFSSDAKFVRLGETFIKGNELGAVASGVIRKGDGAIDITGTIIPAYALNSALSNIPLVGQILSGGSGEGIFGITFALGGSMQDPKFQVNPVSAIAPGIFRKFFEFSNGAGVPPQQRLR